MDRIDAKAVRYIKLGANNSWGAAAIERGELPFGSATAPLDLAARGEWDAIVDHYLKVRNTTPGKAKDLAREVKEFCTRGTDCLWITFYAGKLWWGFAEPTVFKADKVEPGASAGYRKIIGGWSDRNVKGEVLRVADLSTRLTSVSSYRQSICNVKEADYLLRRLNFDMEPVVERALAAKALTISAASELISRLHQDDFEVLADLIFTRGGWRRISVLGKSQADLDLALEHPTTGERAFVQVKSAASQAVLEDYIERFDSDGSFEHFFFLCHSPKGKLVAHANPRMHVWAGETLASAAIDAGLFDWLLNKNM